MGLWDLGLEIEAQQRQETPTRSGCRWPAWTSLNFTAVPSLNKARVLDLAQEDYLDKRENLILMGNHGTGKTPLAIAGFIAANKAGRCDS